jgi:N-methylhydantoinase A/oxoprolinase/acetone carboxylase beta subunit
MTVLEEAEALYGLSLAEFTAARDARVKALKAPDRSLSDAVKALKKPSLAAWVLNLLVRREPDQVSGMITLGGSLRDAAESLDGAQLRELTKQRRQLTAALTTVARRHALAEGHKVTESVADEVESTLTAAMLDPVAATALRSGLLVRAFAVTGLGDLDASSYVAVADALGHEVTSVPMKLHSVPGPTAAAVRRELKQAVSQAERELRIARDDLARATTRHQGAQAKALQLESEIDEVRRRLAELEEREEDAVAAVEKAAATVAEAADEVEAAEAARAAAVAALDAG